MAKRPEMQYLKPTISIKKNSEALMGLDGPRGIAQDFESEQIYVASAGKHFVQVLTPSLQTVFRFGSPKNMATPAGLCIVGNLLYLCNWGANTLALFTLQGEEITQMRETIDTNGTEGFTQPIGVTFDNENETLMVCDYGGNKVKKFDDRPHIFTTVSKPFDVKLTEEFVLIITGENTCLRFYDRNGDLLKVIVSSNQGNESDIGNPSFFGIDCHNTIWLSDYRRHCICHINMEGVMLRRIGGKQNSKTQELFEHPTGLLLDKRGFLVSACVRQDNQVQIFDITYFRFMCIGCVKEHSPDRGTICNDTGAFLLNYAGCKECGSHGFPKEANKVKTEDETGEETVEFEHICCDCNHSIAKHHYSFSVDEADGYQDFEMNCVLCGFGQDKSSVLPNDPSKNFLF